MANLSRMKTRDMWFTLCLASTVAWTQQISAPTALPQQTQTPAASAASPTAATGASTVVEVAREGHHHKLVENEYVRAYFVEIAPHQATLMHHHATDYVAVALGHQVIDSTAPDGTVKHVTLEDGDVRYTPAGVTHAVTNLSDTPFRNWTIELLQNHDHPVCVNDCANDPRAKDWPAATEDSTVIGYGDTFRITEETIKPRQMVSGAMPFTHLTIMLTDFRGHAGASAANEFKQKAGDLVFHEPHGKFMLTNIGDQDARMLRIEFKPISGSPVNSAVPKE